MPNGQRLGGIRKHGIKAPGFMSITALGVTMPTHMMDMHLSCQWKMCQGCMSSVHTFALCRFLGRHMVVRAGGGMRGLVQRSHDRWAKLPMLTLNSCLLNGPTFALIENGDLSHRGKNQSDYGYICP